MEHVYVDYSVYQELKSNKYKLAKGISQFKIDDLDQGVMFFDENDNFIDPERLKIENIKISKVLLPRFLFLENIDKLESFFTSNGTSFADLFKYEEENIDKYGLKEEQEKLIDKIVSNL